MALKKRSSIKITSTKKASVITEAFFVDVILFKNRMKLKLNKGLKFKSESESKS